MKMFISFSGLLVVGAGVVHGVAAFLPVKGTTGTRLATTRSMTIIDDWKDVFGPDGIKKRTERHEREMEEMVKAEKEILERRRDPRKMKQYHDNEEARHRRFDNKHDLDIEEELSKEQVISPKVSRIII
jgi:ATP-dependent protease ClpP protease subunit